MSESGLSLFIFSLLSSSSAISSSLSTSCVYRRAASLPLILPSPTPPHQTFILYCGSFTLILFPYLLFPGPFLPSSLVPPQSRHLLPDPPFNPSYSLHPPTHSPLPHPSVASQEAERTELRYMKVTSNETYPRWAAYALLQSLPLQGRPTRHVIGTSVECRSRECYRKEIEYT